MMLGISGLPDKIHERKGVVNSCGQTLLSGKVLSSLGMGRAS